MRRDRDKEQKREDEECADRPRLCEPGFEREGVEGG